MNDTPADAARDFWDEYIERDGIRFKARMYRLASGQISVAVWAHLDGSTLPDADAAQQYFANAVEANTIVQRGDGVRVSREDANDCLTLAAEECDLYEGSANKWDDAEYRHFTGLHKRLAAALAAGADPA